MCMYDACIIIYTAVDDIHVPLHMYMYSAGL